MAPQTLLDTTDTFTLFYNMTPCIIIVFTQLFAIDFWLLLIVLLITEIWMAEWLWSLIPDNKSRGFTHNICLGVSLIISINVSSSLILYLPRCVIFCGSSRSCIVFSPRYLDLHWDIELMFSQLDSGNTRLFPPLFSYIFFYNIIQWGRNKVLF
jgi:hypothetical protein